MIKFRTAFSGDTGKFVSEIGTPFLDQYHYDVDKKGVQNLVLSDEKKNVYAEIQADYASTDINLLMKRFAFGDVSAINVREGFYADVTEMPTTIAELFDKNTDCMQYFASLPVELKQMFDNSYTQFFTEMNTDPKGFDSKIAQFNDQFVDHSFDIKEPGPIIKESEVNNGEQESDE